jgi:hypothetical protein
MTDRTYSFEVVIGSDSDGNPIYKTFVIEAPNLSQARHILSDQVSKEKL